MNGLTLPGSRTGRGEREAHLLRNLNYVSEREHQRPPLDYPKTHNTHTVKHTDKNTDTDTHRHTQAHIHAR